VDNLIIEGNRYKGIFNAKKETSEFWGGQSYTSYKYDASWYEGTGIIKDKKTGKKYTFALNTPRFEQVKKGDFTFEESVINYGQKSSDPKSIVVPGKYKNIIDIGLERIISKIKDSKKEIPSITPEKLKAEELVERGLCFDELGQRHLAFKE